MIGLNKVCALMIIIKHIQTLLGSQTGCGLCGVRKGNLGFFLTPPTKHMHWKIIVVSILSVCIIGIAKYAYFTSHLKKIKFILSYRNLTNLYRH